MSESTPIFDPSVLQDSSTGVQADGLSSAVSTQNGDNGINGQDIAMGGQEDPENRSVKPSDSSISFLDLGKKPKKATVFLNPFKTGRVTITVNPNRLAQLNLNNNNSNAPTPTAATTMVGRSFVSDAATAGNSRAASADRTGDRVAMPLVAATHGTPTRQYINTNVTYHLLDAMKVIAKEQPSNPLRVLGEFLLERSKQYEETTNGTNGDVAGEETKDVDKNGDE